MNKLIYILFVIINLFALTVKSEGIESEKFHLSLPIIVENDSITHLTVKIPKSFKSLQTTDQMNSGFAEFIPIQDQDPYKWSEIITTTAHIGKSINAYIFVDDLKNSIVKSATNSKIIEHKTKIIDNYKVARLIMSYEFNGRKELIFARYYSGPFDCIGLQYSIVLNSKVTEAKALEKIRNFADNSEYVKVVKIKR